MTNAERAGNIVKVVLDDLEGRSGVGNALEEIDNVTYRELVTTLITLVAEELEK